MSAKMTDDRQRALRLGKGFFQFLVLVLALTCLFALNGCARFKPPRSVTPVVKTMTVTGYCKCGECCGWKRNLLFRPVIASGPNKGDRKRVGITASGTKAKPGTIAADGALYPFGAIMYIKGYGYGRVEDRGGDIKGEHIDLYFHTHRQALKWGKRRMNVTVWAPR